MATDLCDSDAADDGGDDDNAGNHQIQKILCKTWTMKTILYSVFCPHDHFDHNLIKENKERKM